MRPAAAHVAVVQAFRVVGSEIDTRHYGQMALSVGQRKLGSAPGRLPVIAVAEHERLAREKLRRKRPFGWRRSRHASTRSDARPALLYWSWLAAGIAHEFFQGLAHRQGKPLSARLDLLDEPLIIDPVELS